MGFAKLPLASHSNGLGDALGVATFGNQFGCLAIKSQDILALKLEPGGPTHQHSHGAKPKPSAIYDL